MMMMMFITTLSSRTRGHLHRISQGHPLHVRLGPRWSSTPLSILILVLDQLRQGITWTPGKSHRQIHNETASQERSPTFATGLSLNQCSVSLFNKRLSLSPTHARADPADFALQRSVRSEALAIV